MLRIIMPLLFFVVFIGWILYRALIKKDLRQNLNTLYIGLTFTGIWILIYYVMLQ